MNSLDRESGYTTSTAGATLTTLYVKREVVVYAVQQSEYDSISSYNAAASACFAVGSALIAFGVGILTNAVFSTELTPEAKIATKIVAPVLILLGIASVLGGWYANSKKSSAWKNIITQSKQIAEDKS